MLDEMGSPGTEAECVLHQGQEQETASPSLGPRGRPQNADMVKSDSMFEQGNEFSDTRNFRKGGHEI